MQTPLNDNALVLVPIELLTCIGFYCFLLLVVSRLSGWNLLAKSFRSDQPLAGKIWNWQSARMRYLSHYNRCLRVGANSSGLYLVPMGPFRFFHPPLFIPWHEIALDATKQFLWIHYVDFQLGREAKILFEISGKLALKLQREADQNWLKQINPNYP
jgi:hypothetical protein